MRSGANDRSGVAARPSSAPDPHPAGAQPRPTARSAADTPKRVPKPTEVAANVAVGTSASPTRPKADTPGRRNESPRSRVPRPRKKRAYCSHIGSSRCSFSRSATRSSSLAWSPSTSAAGSPGRMRRARNAMVASTTSTSSASARARAVAQRPALSSRIDGARIRPRPASAPVLASAPASTSTPLSMGVMGTGVWHTPASTRSAAGVVERGAQNPLPVSSSRTRAFQGDCRWRMHT